ncbi:MAG: hypothetical protein H7Y11_11080 [Armatimonadetes bacterium]|nr:hypothetical protein [Anaerolineae bacterium]
MNTQQLIRELESTDPRLRFNAARILGMLDETAALTALKKAYKTEEDVVVRSAMAVTGKRLQAAYDENYNSFEALWRHFEVEREVRFVPDTHERHTGLLGADTTSADQRSTRRVPSTEPTKTDIRVHVQRLLRGTEADTRRKAAITLGDLHNPVALAGLAQAFAEDKAPLVREAAQFYGKRIYWGVLYWEMERDGSLLAEIARRRERAGVKLQTGELRLSDAKRVDDLLRRGQQKRQRRD